MTIIGQTQQAIVNVAVWYLRQKNLARLLEAVGLVLDGAADGMLMGMRLSYPLRCPANQLPVILKDRALPSYTTEPTAGTRERARHWWQLHRARGSHQGEMRHMQYYFLPGALPTIHAVHQDGTGTTATWHKLTGAGAYSSSTVTPSNFNYDGQDAKWSRFGVFVDMTGTGIDPGPDYGDGHLYGDGSVYGGGLTPAQTADIVAMIRDWKSARSWLLFVVLVWPPATIDPTATPTQDADGRWSLPNGANTWGVLADPGTGKATRPIGYQWIYDGGGG